LVLSIETRAITAMEWVSVHSRAGTTSTRKFWAHYYHVFELVLTADVNIRTGERELQCQGPSCSAHQSHACSLH
jgi:hypothetical protein